MEKSVDLCIFHHQLHSQLHGVDQLYTGISVWWELISQNWGPQPRRLEEVKDAQLFTKIFLIIRKSSLNPLHYT